MKQIVLRGRIVYMRFMRATPSPRSFFAYVGRLLMKSKIGSLCDAKGNNTIAQRATANEEYTNCVAFWLLYTDVVVVVRRTVPL